MRSRAELDRERQRDLRRVLQAEAALLLLLRRRVNQALLLQLNDVLVAERLFTAVRTAVLEGRFMAGRLSLEGTAEQLRAAVDWRLPPQLSQQWIHEATLAAEAEAHAVSGRWLESRVAGGRAFALEAERRASWEAAQAYNEARHETIRLLPRSVSEALWLRWDTAGDKDVCDRCDILDGRIVRAVEGFDQSAPLHGNCRCTETILGPDEV